MTVTERLTEEIAKQQSEVDRLKQVCEVEYPKALAVLSQMKRLQAMVTPEFERIAAALETIKIRPVDIKTAVEEVKS